MSFMLTAAVRCGCWLRAAQCGCLVVAFAPPCLRERPFAMTAWPAAPHDVNPRRGSLVSSSNGRGTRRRCRVAADAVACAADTVTYSGRCYAAGKPVDSGLHTAIDASARTLPMRWPSPMPTSHTRYAVSASHVLLPPRLFGSAYGEAAMRQA